MPHHWYEVYDDERVRVLTRQGVGRLVVLAAVGLAGVVGLAPLLAFLLPSPPLVAGGVIGLGAALLLIVSRQLLRRRRVVWRVELSVHRAVGYDYAQRRIELPWADVERVDVTDRAVRVAGRPSGRRPAPVFDVPVAFAGYTLLSHRLVEYAEAHGVPICVEGRPWQLMDLTTLYPSLSTLPVMEPRPLRLRRPGGPRSRTRRS